MGWKPGQGAKKATKKTKKAASTVSNTAKKGAKAAEDAAKKVAREAEKAAKAAAKAAEDAAKKAAREAEKAAKAAAKATEDAANEVADVAEDVAQVAADAAEAAWETLKEGPLRALLKSLAEDEIKKHKGLVKDAATLASRMLHNVDDLGAMSVSIGAAAVGQNRKGEARKVRAIVQEHGSGLSKLGKHIKKL